ncbi:sulfate transporter family-domain-containing protein [Tribonema minus]|uniref:Sulfate transporter family-domain-containing protein n=1 Tax=Tribonema minus TaxID=303371 RepID=A0A835ZG79_9STRA|nr:sulfate transporter family-domain-containing protein [Tribonema minus]
MSQVRSMSGHSGPRQRLDSWNDDTGRLHSNDGLRTEADLHNKFQGHGHVSSQLTLKQAMSKDWDSCKAWLKAKANRFMGKAAEIKSAKDVVVVAAKPFPWFKTAANYKLKYAATDMPAGLVEGVMKVPSGLAYALLANMPPEYGLYTSLMPPFIYMLMGTCAQVSFGVTAIEALFLGESVRGVLGDDIVESEDPVDINIVVKYTLFVSIREQGRKLLEAVATEYARRMLVPGGARPKALKGIALARLRSALSAALHMAFMVGIWQLVFRFLRLSFISVLLADPVMSGFSTGGAFIIGTSQLSSLLGVKLTSSDFLPFVWIDAFEKIDQWNWVTIALGLSGLAVLMVFQRLNRRYMPKRPLPWQVFLVIISIVITSQLHLEKDHGVKLHLEKDHGVKVAEGEDELVWILPSLISMLRKSSMSAVARAPVIGDIPPGFPTAEFPTLPTIDGKSSAELLAQSILPSALIALFVYVMTLSLGTYFASKNGYKIVASQELLAIGTANTISSMTGSFICSASFSRTAVLNTLGAQTVMHNVMGISVMILAVTLITDLLYSLPKCILAVVVINAIGPMLEFEHGAKYYKTSKTDFAVWTLTFLICLFAGAMYGIYAGVGIALVIVLWRSASAKIVVMGRCFAGAMYGIYAGVGIALVIVLWRSASAKIVVMGRCFAGAMYGIYAGVGIALVIVLWRSASAKIVVMGRCFAGAMYGIYAGVGIALVIVLWRSASAKIVVMGRCFAGAMYGIYAGVGIALVIVLWRSASAKIVVMGRLPGTTVYRNTERFPMAKEKTQLPGTTVYRNIERFPMAKETDGVKIVRFDGSLNFANWEKVVARLQALATKDIHTIALDASSILTIDSSSLRGLLKLVDVQDFEADGVKLLLANWKAPQRDLLERSGFYERVTDDTLFLTLHDAVLFAKNRVASPKEAPGAEGAGDQAGTITETGGHVWRVGFADKHPSVAQLPPA